MSWSVNDTGEKGYSMYTLHSSQVCLSVSKSAPISFEPVNHFVIHVLCMY